MKLKSLVAAVVVSFPLAAGSAAASCVTIYGATEADVDCRALEPTDTWFPIRPQSEILLFKNIWGKGKDRRGELKGPQKAGGSRWPVRCAGPALRRSWACFRLHQRTTLELHGRCRS